MWKSSCSASLGSLSWKIARRLRTRAGKPSLYAVSASTRRAASGLVSARPGTGHFDTDDLVVAQTARELADFGFEPRHLRAFKTAADREVGLVQQVVAPIARGRDAGARGRAEEATSEIAALSVRLHATLVKVGLLRG